MREIVTNGLKKCICGGMILVFVFFHSPAPHTHQEPYRPAPIRTITVQVSTTSSFTT